MYCYNCMSKIKDGSFCTHCMSENNVENAPHHLNPGTILNKKYIVGNVLGEGGFGITYIGLDTTLDIRVAIKEYYPNGYVNRNHDATNDITITTEKHKSFFDKGKQRFISEARNIAKFNRESGIVDVRDYFEENETAYIIMEYLDGQSLGNYLKNNGIIDAKEAFTLMLPIMESLKKMHTAGIIHRDISPDNLMYMKDGTLMLMDFGSARYFSNEEKEMSIILKHGYAPEEQYRKNSKQGPWTDVYGMCATIYRCVTGVVPETSLDRLHTDNLKKPSELGINIQKSFEAILMHGLAVHKENRYQDMSELVDQVQLALHNQSINMNNKTANQEDIYKTEFADDIYKTQAADQINKSVQTPDDGYSYSINRPAKQKRILPLLLIITVSIAILIGVIAVLVYVASDNDSSEKIENTETTFKATEITSTQAAEELSVPNVVGLTSNSAIKTLSEAGLKAEIITTKSNEVESNCVISQFPVANEKASYGDTVSIYIAENVSVATTKSKDSPSTINQDQDSFSITKEEIDKEVELIRDYYYYPTNNDSKIVIEKGTNNWEYSRDYRFHNNKLVFAFIFNGTEERRLYFKDDHMIRYIDENSVTYDYGELEPYRNWEEKVLTEAYSLN